MLILLEFCTDSPCQPRRPRPDPAITIASSLSETYRLLRDDIFAGAIAQMRFHWLWSLGLQIDGIEVLRHVVCWWLVSWILGGGDCLFGGDEGLAVGVFKVGETKGVSSTD